MSKYSTIIGLGILVALMPSIILFLILPALVLAATSDFVANGNITVSGVTFGAGTTSMVIVNGSTAESWLFNSGAFTVTNPGTAFNVSSSDSTVKSIQVTSGATTLLCSENTTPGTSYATLPSAPGTYTVLPSATAACTSLCTVLSNTATYNAFPTCGALSCSAGYQLSGSGASATCVVISAGAISLPIIISPPTTISSGLSESQVQSIIALLNSFGVDQTTIDKVTASLRGTASDIFSDGSKKISFARNLQLRSTGVDVLALQQYLNTKGFMVAATGPGSPGKETVTFGSLTKSALIKFQKAHAITPAVGYFGPKTRAVVGSSL